jgi:4-amino-4-deoxy-L-arabinose transferase-like glycosyltransferase
LNRLSIQEVNLSQLFARKRQLESIGFDAANSGFSTGSLVLVLALVLLVRFVLLGVSIGDRITFDPDEAWFISIASSLASEGRFGTHLWGDWAGSADQTFWYMPGQIVAVAGALKIFGTSYIVPRIVVLAVSAAAIGMTYLLGKRLFDTRVGLIAALVLALDPLFIFSSGYFRPEVWVALFGSGSLFLLVRPKSRLSPVFAGVTISIAAGFHPNGVIFLAGAIVFLAIHRRWPEIGRVVLGFVPLAVMYGVYGLTGGDDFVDQASWNYLHESSFAGNITAEGSRYSSFIAEHKAHIGIALLWLLGVAFAIKKRSAGAIPLLVMLAVALIAFTVVRNKWYVYFSVISPFLAILAAVFIREAMRIFIANSSTRGQRIAQVLMVVAVPLALAGYLTLTSTVVGFDWDRNRSSLTAAVPSGAKVLSNPVFETALPLSEITDCMRIPSDPYLHVGLSTNEVMESFQFDIVILDRTCRLSWNGAGSRATIDEVLNGFTLLAEFEDAHYGRDELIEVWGRNR